MEKVLWWSIKAIDRSVTVCKGVRGFCKGSKRSKKVRGIKGGCSEDQGLRIKGFVKVYICVYKLPINCIKT